MAKPKGTISKKNLEKLRLYFEKKRANDNVKQRNKKP